MSTESVGTRHIGCMGDDHSPDIGANRLGDVFRIDKTFAVEGNQVEIGDALLLHVVQRPQHGIVLQAGRHDVVSRLHTALQL